MSKVGELIEKLLKLDVQISKFQKQHSEISVALGNRLINKGQILNNALQNKKCRVIAGLITREWRNRGYKLDRVRATRILKSGSDGQNFIIYSWDFKDWGIE